MGQRITKRWQTAAGLTAMILEGDDTIGYVGVSRLNSFYGKRRAEAQELCADLSIAAGGLAFAGELVDPVVSIEDRTSKWWFGFSPAADEPLSEMLRRAESIARVLKVPFNG